jgi:hypothetical protein
MTPLKLITKSGTAIEVEISGFQESPIIIMKPQVLKGMTIGGEGSIAASQKRTGKTPAPVDSLYFKPAFFQMDLAPVYAAIAALPRKVCMARKVVEIIDLDGNRCPVQKWTFDGICKSPKTGDYIAEDEMAQFLNDKNLSDIEITKACQMWADENETDEKIAARKAANERGNKIAQHFADMEEMENGHALLEERDPTPYCPREG